MQRWHTYGDMANIPSGQCDKKTYHFSTPKHCQSKCQERLAQDCVLHQEYPQQPKSAELNVDTYASAWRPTMSLCPLIESMKIVYIIYTQNVQKETTLHLYLIFLSFFMQVD